MNQQGGPGLLTRSAIFLVSLHAVNEALCNELGSCNSTADDNGMGPMLKTFTSHIRR